VDQFQPPPDPKDITATEAAPGWLLMPRTGGADKVVCGTLDHCHSVECRMMNNDVTRLDDGRTWLCCHVDAEGTPAAPSRLRLEDAVEWPHPTNAPRRMMRCPVCGTLWRAWPEMGVAKDSRDSVSAGWSEDSGAVTLPCETSTS